MVVPRLGQLFARALFTTPTTFGGGKRTVQNPPRRSAGPGAFSRSKTQEQSDPPPRQRPRFGLPKPSNAGDPLSIRSPRTSQKPTTSRRLNPISNIRDPASSSRSPSGRSAPLVDRKSTSSRQDVREVPQTSSESLRKPFDTFSLHPALQESLKTTLEISGKTTPIQTLSFEHLINKTATPSSADFKQHSVILGAETGSGKTLAYLLPLLHHLKATDHPPYLYPTDAGPLVPRSIVLSPTHELTRQSTGVAKSLSHGIKLSVSGASSTYNGGISRSGNVDVMFSTGGTLRKMLGISRDGEEAERDKEIKVEERIKLDKVEWVVVDEADVLLGPDFAAETIATLSKLPPSVSTIFVSATVPPSLTHHLETTFSSRKWTKLLSPGLHQLPKTLSTRFINHKGGNLYAEVVKEAKKAFAEDSLSLTGRRTKVVVFANSDKKVQGLHTVFEEKGLGSLAWTGEASQRIRGKNGDLDGFLSGNSPGKGDGESPRVLITTSLLSRGLDFSEDTSTIILLDPPRDTLDFVHRAGRAGRAGRKGRVIVFGMGDGRDLLGRGSVAQGVRSVVRKSSKRIARPS